MEKSIMLIDEIIYTKGLYNLLKDYKNDITNRKFTISKFGKDCIRCIILIDDNKERLSEATDEIINDFMDAVRGTRTIILDEEDLIRCLEDTINRIEGGISSRIFNKWFMYWAFQLSQTNLPLNNQNNIDKKYLPRVKVTSFNVTEEEKVIGYRHYIFFSSNGEILNDFYEEELLKKADKIMKEKLKEKLIIKKEKKRDPIETRLRHEVFKKDNFKCRECGKSNKETTLHCDHIIPISRGGTDELNNLQTLCQACNLTKSDKIFSNE